MVIFNSFRRTISLVSVREFTFPTDSNYQEYSLNILTLEKVSEVDINHSIL